jgi:beta-lactamase class A
MHRNRKDSKSRKSFFKLRIPVYLAAVLIASTFFFFCFFFSKQYHHRVTTQKIETANCSEEMEILRSNNSHLSHPSYLYDIRNENARLSVLKEKLTQFLEANKSSNGLTDMSVYYRNLLDGSWFEINGGHLFNPASLMKVPFLIAILKQSMNDPSYLDKKYILKNISKKSTSKILLTLSFRNVSSTL